MKRDAPTAAAPLAAPETAPVAAPVKPEGGHSSRHDAAILAYIGASGSGKSRSMRAYLSRAKPRRLLMWDPMDEYADLAVAAPTLAAAVSMASQGKPARFVPKGPVSAWGGAFEAICAGAYDIGRVCFVVEELADVTQAAWAPESWARISRSGRHRGMTVLAASQRPASIDKGFLGNCSRVRCFRLNWTGDVRVMAGILGVKPDEVQRLEVGQWVERDLLSGQLSRGRL